MNACPAKHSDQLVHAVLVPRTVQVMKKHGYSDSYQMCHVQEGFNGLDSYDVTEMGKFDFISELSARSEGL